MRDPVAFRSGSGNGPSLSESDCKRTKGSKRYVPQKNSVAYALLITLYRGTKNGNEFMSKQELIDAAEASGLSRVPIMPEKGKGKPTTLGNSSRECRPAKYMLTEEGQEAACECLMRPGLADPVEKNF
ncbi:hypothetical protein M0R45_006213 [Rubus argutus]|uniref:Crossover junction endonuclease MUS81 n=1 Tax=Rubus argutus TaxID=59490 RepID=A0AAW1YQH7_RUBAR